MSPILAALALSLQSPPPQLLGQPLAEPVPAPNYGPADAWGCEVPVIYQGVCPRDHSGLSMDAGGDWNGDGMPDVVMGGGTKVDIEGQPNRSDESANGVSLFLRCSFAVPVRSTER